MSRKKLNILADENMPLVEELFSDFANLELKAGRSIRSTDLQDKDILLVRSITKVDQALLAESEIKFVGSATIGTDHIDKSYLQQRGIEFAYAPGCNAQAVTEYVLCAIAYWAKLKGRDLTKVKVGIIGAGNVGSRLSKLLDVIGIDYIVNDPLLEAKGDRRKFCSLQQIQQCDVVSCHVPLTRSGEYPSYHMINQDFLLAMPKGSLLLNSSRGAVLDNQAAIDCKDKNKLDYILDVWENEPNLNTQLLDLCLLGTPHIAGYSYQGKIRGSYMLYEQVCRWLDMEKDISLHSILPQSKKWQPAKKLVDLHDSLIEFYDIQQDDKALRWVQECLASEFDLLRKKYKTRLEFL